MYPKGEGPAGRTLCAGGEARSVLLVQMVLDGLKFEEVTEGDMHKPVRLQYVLEMPVLERLADLLAKVREAFHLKEVPHGFRALR